MLDSSPARSATLWLSTGWLMLIFVAPLLYTAELAASIWLYQFFEPICHQIADRSFVFMGAALPVCARCLGLYTGFWIGLLVLPKARFLTSRLERRPRLIIFFSIPLIIDLITSNTHWTRLASGLLASLPFPFFVCKAFDPLICAFRRIPKGVS